ncbi:helix-turn-helix domain-containing protein [Bradyrhizobium sp. GCM10023182]|uniref:Helix-turn-helix domain-containing protein n=1 Tax=Bradyrhizobium zhengyangense TaxID=2911009 RepID=A0ABS9LP07_9BRAD|nr:helix-turn-helix domain-containing protein [Bradyrhizobium zhengyangense]MCG2668758.1 helix-turn-helix domain-containing protein [Bradyrhizobium zhengyangense]
MRSFHCAIDFVGRTIGGGEPESPTSGVKSAASNHHHTETKKEPPALPDADGSKAETRNTMPHRASTSTSQDHRNDDCGLTPREHTSRLFAWLKQVRADRKNLTASTFVVAFTIADHMNKETGEAFPGMPCIAREIGMSQGTVKNAIDALEARGHLHVHHGKKGRGCPNRYRMLVRASDADGLPDGPDRANSGASLSDDDRMEHHSKSQSADIQAEISQPSEIWEGEVSGDTMANSQETEICEPSAAQLDANECQSSASISQPFEPKSQKAEMNLLVNLSHNQGGMRSIPPIEDRDEIEDREIRNNAFEILCDSYPNDIGDRQEARSAFELTLNAGIDMSYVLIQCNKLEPHHEHLSMADWLHRRFDL